MLQRIRDNSSGPVAYAIVGLIALVFGVWGIGSYFTPSANPVVASVGDVKITRYQLQQTYNQRYRRLRNVMGDRFNPETFEPQQLRRAILQDLIRSAVIDQYAVSHGYRTTDQALLRVLTSNPRFRVNGEFSTRRYKALLANAGLTAAVYERRLRQNMASRQVRAGVVNSAFVAPPSVMRAYSALKQKRRLSYLVFPAEAYIDRVELSSDEVRAWYEHHQDRFMRPERVKLAYVELKRSSLDAARAVSKKDLRSLYEQRKARFSTPDRRDGWRIFVPVTQDNAAEARRRIQTIAGKLEQGRSFDDIAAGTGGSVKVKQLDSVSRSQLPDDIADTFFSIDLGQLSTPIRGDKGWYLVKPTAAQPGKLKPFSSPEVQQQLKKMARRQWRNQRFDELAKRMETLAFQAPNSLETLSTELDLKIQHTGWITRAEGQGEGLGQSAAVRQAAFSNAVLNKRLNSTAIPVGEGRRVVVRIAAHQAPQQRPLAEVRDKVRRQLKADKARQLARQAAQEAMRALKQGDTTLEKVAAQTPARLEKAGYIGRTASNVPGSVRQALFALPAPGGDKAVYRVASLAGGGTALVALRDVKTDVLAKDEAIPAGFVQRQRAYVAQLEYAAFADYLNQHAEVEIMQEQLDFK